ncbi:MAG: glycogen synthase GlgA [Methylophilaceae bacterium]
MHVLFVTSEAFPLIKTGGLADVSGALPKAIKNLSDFDGDIKILIPAYNGVLQKLRDARQVATITALGQICQLYAGKMPDSQVEVIAIHNSSLYEREGGPYNDVNGNDWPDNALRFGVLSRIASLLSKPSSPLNWQPTLIHCNDWQTGLTPIYVKLVDQTPVKTVFSIHNMAYQGNFDRTVMKLLELPPTHFTINGYEFYNQISFMKAGLYYADFLSTVSPTYAKEIQTADYGFGLQGLLKTRQQKLIGILNGIDIEDWNPKTDQYLNKHYSTSNMTGKKTIKSDLQKTFGLNIDANAPLLGIVSRFAYQKGLDLLPQTIPALIAEGCQIAILGSGEKSLEDSFAILQKTYPNQVGVKIGYNEILSHNIMAGADMFIMPSRFEPCGLNQLYGLAYGTPPIVSATGGLADSVNDSNPESIRNNTATGFVIKNVTHVSLLVAIRHAVSIWKDKKTWREIQKNGMKTDVSWASSAISYLELYKKTLDQ